MDRETKAAVLFVNQAFYEAFNARDADAMEAIWAQGEPVLCVHPGWPPLIGRESVLKSWRQILGNPGAPEIRCAEPQVHFAGGVAIVTCFELLGRGTLVASNLFVLEEGAWKLMHHHASPSPQAPRSPDPEPKDESPGRLN